MSGGLRSGHTTMEIVQDSDWIKRLNLAVDYLESQLEARLTTEDAARVACSSPFHFQRMFQLFAGITPGRYVRYRRLWLAAVALKEGGSVGEVALRFQYESPEAFSRAFKQRYGISPSHVGTTFPIRGEFRRINIAALHPENHLMKYQIIESEAFRWAGPTIRTTMDENESDKTIANFWIRLMQTGEFMQLLDRSLGKTFPKGTTFGLCLPDSEECGPFTYAVAIETDAEPAGTDSGGVVEGGTYAVFDAVGDPSESIPKVFRQVYQSFFEEHPYEQRPGAPELEVYPDAEPGPDYVCHVWIPVQPKS